MFLSNDTESSLRKFPLKKRKLVIITARVHAAETMGSFKVEGIIDFLISNQPIAMELRSLYIFKIIPMLNPEGVIAGNYRCSITGVDLNRRWNNPDEILHPQIFYLKSLLRKYKTEGREILVYCDLHGHSRKLNSFIYGCNKAANGGFCSWTKVRLLPRILATKTPLFSYNDSNFRVVNSKQSTARVVVWKELGVTNSFTLESSFFGYMRGNEITPFTIKDYYEIGYTFLKSLVEYYYVLKLLEKELILTKGWLKPSRLLALTGVLAADKLEKKLALEKREAKVKKRVMEAKEISKQMLSRPKRIRKYSINKEKTKEKNNDYHIVSKSITEVYKKNTRENSIDIIDRKFTMSQLKFVSTRVTSSDNSREYSLGTAGRNKDKLKPREGSVNQSAEGSEDRGWRRYFPKRELEIAYKQITAGIDPNDIVNEHDSEYESDSNPSEDNLETEDMQDLLSSIPEVSFI